MSRLLFAAARGARIQELATFEDDWFDLDMAPMSWDITDDHRIHPDDAHLQYGPISTALREFAKNPPQSLISMGGAIEELCQKYKRFEDGIYYYADELHRSLFLLILAEALADEGL